MSYPLPFFGDAEMMFGHHLHTLSHHHNCDAALNMNPLSSHIKSSTHPSFKLKHHSNSVHSTIHYRAKYYNIKATIVKHTQLSSHCLQFKFIHLWPRNIEKVNKRRTFNLIFDMTLVYLKFYQHFSPLFLERLLSVYILSTHLSFAVTFPIHKRKDSFRQTDLVSALVYSQEIHNFAIKRY